MLDGHLAINLWQEAAHLAPVDRAVRTLAAIKQIDADAAADWAVDERDRALIEARCESFGAMAEFYVVCPQCDEALETRFDLRALLAADRRAAPVLNWSGAEHELRAPTSRDVAMAARNGDRAGLVQACVVGLDAPAGGPDVALVEKSLEQAFPLLNIMIDFTCPACDAAFSRPFDASAYLWADLERRAESLIDEVHRLARAYGWSERDILAMSPRRRAAYLERLQS